MCNNKCRKNLFSTPKHEAQAVVETEVVELLSEEELDVLKQKLLTKLNLRAQSIGVKLFSSDNIVSEIEPYISNSRSALKKITYKYSVKCVMCDVCKPCTNVGHWQISNLEKHLKEHPIEINEDKISKQNVDIENRAKSLTVSSQSAVSRELDSVLRSGSESD